MSLADFQNLASQNLVRTPDGRYFLPFSKTHLGQQQMQQDVDESGAPVGEKYYRSGYDPESGFQKYSSLEDYFNATNPGSAGVVGPGAQNGIGINTQGMSAEQIAGLRGKYNDEFGYYVDPSRIVGTHPATTAGMKPNEGGLWQLMSLLLPAVGGIVGAAGEAGAAGSEVGSSAFEGNVPAAAGSDAATGGSEIGASEGSSNMTGSAGGDKLVDTYGTGVDANGNPTGEYANGTRSSLDLGNSNFWGPVGGALISGYLGSEASKKAAGTMADASRSVVDMQKGIYDTTRSDLSPYRAAGMPALQQLSYLTGLSPQGVNGETGNSGALLKPFDYSQVDLYKDPSYQFRQSEGEKALTRGYASRGLAQSTPGLKSLMTFNQGLASTEYGNAFSRAFGVDSANKERTTNVLMGLAGIGQNAAAGTASAGIATGNTAANALITGAQASAAGITGSASAYNNAIQGGLSNYLYQQRFDQMMQRMPVFNSGGGSTARAY